MEDPQINSKKSLKIHHNQLDKLQKLIETLRGKDGCPWDIVQTPDTMAVYLIEEVYELVEAIEIGKTDEIRGELGDVLFHIFFIAALFKDKGHFDIQDVANFNVNKMVRRHPHVFGDKKIDNADKVREQWHRIKMKENADTESNSVPASVTQRLPALMRAYRISERAARAGFDWNDISGVMEKTEEEWGEFKAALSRGNDEEVLIEFGDILFTLVNVARFAGIHPETALAGSIRKFNNRFKRMEKIVSDNNETIDSLPQDKLDRVWEKAKEDEYRNP